MAISFKFKPSNGSSKIKMEGTDRIGRKWLLLCFWLGTAGLLGVVLSVWCLLAIALPALDGEIELADLDAPVSVEIDEHGIPLIHAQTRIDSFRALGFVHGRDRLFQMDLMRRSSAGRLAEVLGPGAIKDDKWHKIMGFQHVADAIFARLPERQRAILIAYAQGVNGAIAQLQVLPWEFWLLGYRPEAWRAEDCLLVILGLYERLSWSGENERAATVMESAFSSRVAEFFFPARDCYTESLLDAGLDQCRLGQIPVEDLSTTASNNKNAPFSPIGNVPTPLSKGGSNAWVIAPQKSRENRAILANDMHLELRVPNIWYRADLRYETIEVTGLTLPGIPLVISGSNGLVAWGFTNVSGDFSDFILLDTEGGNKDTYLTPEGPRRFDRRAEIIHVRGGPQVSLVVKETIWGPVLPEKLIDKQVAVRWTALDPSATDIKLVDLIGVSSVAEAITLLNRAGGPPLNALVADKDGNIGWTYTGRIPIRVGFSGLAARSWSDGTKRWQGYIPPDELPRIINPTSGFIVSANQRMTGRDYPYAIAHNFDGGYRAYHISQMLQQMQRLVEPDMLTLQLDTKTEFYSYYQRLVLKALEHKAFQGENALRAALRRQLAGWDGKAEPDSLGLGVLVELQRLMAEAIFAPLLEHCREIDPGFDWKYYRETSLRQVLDAKPNALLPKRPQYVDWDDLIVAMAEESARRLMARVGTDRLDDVSWGRINVVPIKNPLSAALPSWLGPWLDMPLASLPGCAECIRWSGQEGGATERLVVSPGYEKDGIFEMPGGQSANPLSAFYRDLHQDWAEGVAAPLRSGPFKHRLILQSPAIEQ